MSTTPELTCLADGDVILYQCGFSADTQVRKQWTEENPELGQPSEDYFAELDYTAFALHNAKQLLLTMQQQFTGGPVRVYLTGTGNYREQLAVTKPYKGNRDTKHKPKYFKELKEYLLDVWQAEMIHGREADDAMGCAQWARWKDGHEDTVIATIDKDLDNIPGYHYNWRRDEVYYVDQDKADRLFWLQALTGDTVDNIQGIPGCGPKTAEKILAGKDSWEDMYAAVRNEYIAKGLGEDSFYENASLVWIQREEGLNFDDAPFHYNRGDDGNEDREDASEAPAGEEGQGDPAEAEGNVGNT